MTVVFYTATCYLDISLDVINVLKNVVNLHVLIEIHPGAKTFTVIDVDKLPETGVLLHPSKVLNDESYRNLEPYFNGVASVHFAVHSKKSVFTFLKASREINRFIRKIKPDVFHIEALLMRSAGLLPSLLHCKKLVVGIHDPVPHSGENNRAESIIKNLWLRFPMSRHYLFYSRFAKEQFKKYYVGNTSPKDVLEMKPYTYFSARKPRSKSSQGHILFFGRLSVYKGIDVLLRSMPSVLEEFPDASLIIAGKSVNGYTVDESIVKAHENNITVLNRHISNEELVQLISDAKFVVCPYVDATQSGVLMTAFALNTPVVASNVGAFPEYIVEGDTGYLSAVGDAEMLADKIKLAMRDEAYTSMRSNLSRMSETNQWHSNAEVLLTAYRRGQNN